MRVERPGGTGTVAGGKAVRRSGSEGFSLSAEEHTTGAVASSAMRSIGGIDALMALQGIEEPGERRRRAVRRGRSALEVLDQLKVGLLAGDLDGIMVHQLKSAAAGLKEASGDPALDALLAEIELRVEVELAKMQPLQA